MQTALQFLKKMYLPGFMSVINLDFSDNILYFDFMPVEPRVTVLSDKYLTPRGSHICLSQASYCLFERLIQQKEIADTQSVRNIAKQGRLKLVEFNQRFRIEIGLSKTLQGKLTITKLRPGRMPLIKIDFNLANRSITGNLTGVIAPHSVPQTNQDILRN